ncbi:hypothetical protein CBR_g32364 [Chara braunii]|uniref:Uncharacterized protein n=1 Tax=Chara braunii TaxID=69332 RepID=A0A388JYC9_CHABU|nr:hypothetical protein CBR_g32364 [Chara braunii]|eukprot:GBG62775.1 hypothetical protein CBR_g32364 [Chara braunii]
MTCNRDHVVCTWVTPGQMLPGNARGSSRLRCKLCNKEYSGNRKRAWEHFILARASARCPHLNLSIWRRLHGIGVQLPPDLHQRVQRMLEMEKSDEGDTPVQGGGEGGKGGIVEDPREAPDGDTMEVDIGEDEGTRGVVTVGLATAGRAGSSQVVRLEVCERAVVRIVTGYGWETMLWRGNIRAKAYFVEETVLDKAFWADVKKLTAVMKRFYDVLREVDKDVHCLSRIYDMACRLPGFVRSAPLSADQRNDLLRDVGKRTDMLLSPIHAAARLLDPMLRVFSNVDLMAQFV